MFGGCAVRGGGVTPMEWNCRVAVARVRAVAQGTSITQELGRTTLPGVCSRVLLQAPTLPVSGLGRPPGLHPCPPG